MLPGVACRHPGLSSPRERLPIVYVLLVLQILVPYETLFNPLNYTLGSLQFDPVAGVAADQTLVGTLLWLYLSLAVSLPVLALWLSAQFDWRLGWRRVQRPWMALLTVAGLISGAGAASVYAVTVQNLIVPPPVHEQLDAWGVTSASHTGTIHNNIVHIIAQLQLVNAADDSQTAIVFRLNPGLVVEQASINGQAVTPERIGETIRLQYSTSAITSGQTATVDLVYTGTPVLLREDYAPASGGPNALPTRFARPVRTFITNDVLMLQRDGDWRAWPQTTAPYRSQHDTIALTVDSYRITTSSGTAAARTSAGSAYRWSSPIPQLLLAAGNYAPQQTTNGAIALPPFGDQRDTGRAEQALALRRAIEPQLATSVPATLDLVFLPYAREVVAGGNTLGIPATNLRLVSVNTFDLYDRWANDILAVQVAQALLADTVAWPIDHHNINGQIGSFSSECSSDLGRETCTVTSTGGISPQAPNGRITEPPASSLLQAWSIVLGRYITPGVLDTQTITEERQFWQQLGSDANNDQGESFDATYELMARGLISRSTLPDQAQHLARLVVQVDTLYQTYSAGRPAQLLQELAIAYPPGGAVLTDEAFQSWTTAKMTGAKGSEKGL